MQSRETLTSIIAERLGTDDLHAAEALFWSLKDAGKITFDERDGYTLADGLDLIDEFEQLLSDLRAEMAEYIGQPESRDEREDAMRAWLATQRGQMLRALGG
jgi:hypothetical protein